MPHRRDHRWLSPRSKPGSAGGADDVPGRAAAAQGRTAPLDAKDEARPRNFDWMLRTGNFAWNSRVRKGYSWGTQRVPKGASSSRVPDEIGPLYCGRLRRPNSVLSSSRNEAACPRQTWPVPTLPSRWHSRPQRPQPMRARQTSNAALRFRRTQSNPRCLAARAVAASESSLALPDCLTVRLRSCR